MKRIILQAILLAIFCSCSKYSEQVKVVKKDTEKNLSEIEKSDIKYTCFEMSDRKAYNEITNFDLMKLQKAEKDYNDILLEFKLGKYRSDPLDEMSDAELINYEKKFNYSRPFSDRVKASMKKYSNDVKELAKLKGEKIYYKVEVLKTNTDTIIYRNVYLDNQNKIIYTMAFK
ncbi:hypothetical protein [Flavobacterium hibisci]|uniref:hypothetical protein n=1 Tax=Flavobacterium hibisci TaxID=1914462 RepID=UPI001CC04279|nr:hypothetical protein [Flavobacterium hibisci]MBZ4044500.1 hypothetical protein [Flavobacterium hibisci]